MCANLFSAAADLMIVSNQVQGVQGTAPTQILLEASALMSLEEIGRIGISP
jgi:hypothetical protein